VVLLAVLLAGGISLLSMIRLSNSEIFEQTKVNGSLLNFSSQAISEANESVYTDNFYFFGGFSVIINGDYDPKGGIFLKVTNDIERYLSGLADSPFELRYGKGGDDLPSVVIGNMLAVSLGLEIGDEINLLSWEQVGVLAELFDETAYAQNVADNQGKFMIAGIVTSDLKNIAEGIFAPLSPAIESISVMGADFPVEYAEFTLVDKENPHETAIFFSKLSMYEQSGFSGEPLFHMDTSELENIKRIRNMLTMLFPLAFAAVIFIGLTVPLLIIAQLAKEVAVLRILGTTKVRIHCILAFEQIILCCLGLAAVAIYLVLYDMDLFLRSGERIIFIYGIYLFGYAGATIFASMAVTKRKILSLLQAKG
jgi:ABC-type lipoprotein release transport system permease subunit